jgi:beta-galactosidase GanA
MTLRTALLAVSALAASLSLAAPALADAPRLETKGDTKQLIVNGKPMLMIAGELSNSASSSAAYMAPHWKRLKEMNLDTVLTPVSWELIEPTEGTFDWSSVDSQIKAARANNLKLVVLWFGAWKNSMSTYIPAWVKRDQQRFPRAQLPNGQGVEILSTFGAETLKADERAYAALMAHLKAVDSTQNTVVMVQVENEIGMLPVARDYSAAANAAYREPVPAELVNYLVAHKDSLVPGMRRMWLERGGRTRGSWDELFGGGDAAAEVFAAWHYARFADQLAAAGKAAYPIPMYVNVALNRPGRIPGEYPSGGPLPHLLDVWKAGGPHLDFLAPDIYFSSFVDIVNGYKRPDNVLFIPEAHNSTNPVAPANAFYAIGQLDAIGFGPFSIDSVDEDPGALKDAYGVLQQLKPYILDAQGTDRMVGFKPRQLYDETLVYEPETRDVGPYRFTIAYADIQRPVANPGADASVPGTTAAIAAAGGMIIQIGPEEYLIAGQGITVTFKPRTGKAALAGIDSAFEGEFDSTGKWVPGRLLNGDQTHQGRHIRLESGKWQIQRVKLYDYD